MTTGDPFEEYLQKKKVEMLEASMRGDENPAPEPDDLDEPLVLADDDADTEQRLQDEMRDFFESGGSAGAELFEKVGSEGADDVFEEDQAEEIRDALDEVFQAEDASPQVAPDNETFVEFFEQVQQSFNKAPGAARPAVSLEDQPTATSETSEPDAPIVSVPTQAEAQEAAPEAQATPAAHVDEPAVPELVEPKTPVADTGEWPEAAQAEPDADENAAADYCEFPSPEPLPEAHAEDEDAAGPGLAAFGVDTAALAAEIEACEDVDGSFGDEDSLDSEAAAEDSDSVSDLNLAEILARPVESPESVESELVERVNLLSRVVAKLVDGGKLDQSEILEILVKSGVEF
ncbi:MAG: hypothetical protein V3T86_07670 [Planctomycetota bacterium]